MIPQNALSPGKKGYLLKVITRRLDLYVLTPIYLALCISAICKRSSLVMFRCQTCVTRGTRTLESLCNVHHLLGILTPLPTGRKLGAYTVKQPTTPHLYVSVHPTMESRTNFYQSFGVKPVIRFWLRWPSVCFRWCDSLYSVFCETLLKD